MDALTQTSVIRNIISYKHAIFSRYSCEERRVTVF